MKNQHFIPFLSLLLLFVVACEPEETNLRKTEVEKPKVDLAGKINSGDFQDLMKKGSNAKQVQPIDGEQIPIFGESLEELSESLLAVHPNMKLVKAEFMVDRSEGLTIIADHRVLDLSSRWVPGDPRRSGSDDLSYLVFQPFAIANGITPAEGAIDAGWSTWNTEVDCNNVFIAKTADTGVWPSAILTLGGVPGDPSVSDMNTVGFLPGAIFDIVLGAGASSSVLGVTFTFIFLDEEGNPTDVDGNGKTDTAFKEIWYNDNFLWSTDGSPGVDIESVAVHENGHALEKGHIGVGYISNATGEVGFTPRAIMNAAYFEQYRDPAAMDNRSHCLVFGTWPIQ